LYLHFTISTIPADDRGWQPVPVVSGHFAGVQDLCWSPHSLSSGDDDENKAGAGAAYVVSTSLDQTTRLFAPWSSRVDKPGFKMHLGHFLKVTITFDSVVMRALI
jgi:hypothetical protein